MKVKPQVYVSRRRRHQGKGKALLILLLVIVLSLALFYAGSGIYDFVKSALDSLSSPSATNENPNPSNDADNTNPSADNIVSTKDNGADEGNGAELQVKIKGIYIPFDLLLNEEQFKQYAQNAAQSGINAFVITVKDHDGKLVYKTANEMVNAAGAVRDDAVDIAPIMAILKELNIKPIAKIACFKDDTAPRKMVSDAVSIKKDYLWLDRDYHRWLNPYSEKARDYLISIIADAASVGFEQIQLDWVQFPDRGKLELIDYAENANIPRQDALTSFVNSAKAALGDDEELALSVFPEAVYGAATEASGLNMDFGALNDIILAPVAIPSLFVTDRQGVSDIGGTKITHPDTVPFDTVSAFAKVCSKLENMRIIPYIKAYTSTSEEKGRHIDYGAAQINDEIRALENAGIYEFILLNPKGEYSLDELNLSTAE